MNKLELQKKQARLARRHRRVRGKIFGTPERPRLCITRSNNNIYAQVIDDVNGVTLCSASSLDKAIEGNHARPRVQGDGRQGRYG